MTPKEIVQGTLEFAEPQRVARSFGDSDFVGTAYNVKTHSSEWKEIGNSRWERADEWGNIWGRVDPTSKGEVVKGVLEDIAAIDNYSFPDFSHAEDYAPVKQQRLHTPDKWLLGYLPGFAFSIARKMRKLDQYLMDLILERERMHVLHNRIDVILTDMIRNYAQAGVDAVMFCEDWGTQEQTLVSPDLWKEEFFPRYVRLCSLAHQSGIRVFMHSCGKIEAIVPGLMEAGIDVLQFDQPDLHGLDKLASYQEKGRITFWCPVDIQRTLQSKDESAIRSKAREMLDKLWQGRGGFIAGYYTDNASIGLEPKWQDIASDEFAEFGKNIG